MAVCRRYKSKCYNVILTLWFHEISSNLMWLLTVIDSYYTKQLTVISRTIFELFDIQNVVTLKSMLAVTQGHWKWHHFIDHIINEYLFAFYCNYGRILYRFRNKARYWPKNVDFSYSLVFNSHDPLEPVRIFPSNFNTNCPSPRAIRRCKKIAEKFNSLPMGCNNTTDDSRTAHAISRM